MSSKSRPRRSTLSPGTVLGIIALVLAVGGFAIAAIPSTNGAITACYVKKTGALRVVASAKRCAHGEKTITWNQKGPVGPQGSKGDPGPPGSPGPRGLEGDPGLPATSLWAAVRANGTNSRGSGVVSTKKISSGFYEVTFTKDVTSCDFIATLGNPDALEITPGQIGAAQNLGGGFSNLPTQVLVATSNSTGAAVDLPFFLTVIC